MVAYNIADKELIVRQDALFRLVSVPNMLSVSFFLSQYNGLVYIRKDNAIVFRTIDGFSNIDMKHLLSGWERTEYSTCIRKKHHKQATHNI